MSVFLDHNGLLPSEGCARGRKGVLAHLHHAAVKMWSSQTIDGFAMLNPPCNPCGVHVVLLLDSHTSIKETIHLKYLMPAQVLWSLMSLDWTLLKRALLFLKTMPVWLQVGLQPECILQLQADGGVILHKHRLGTAPSCYWNNQAASHRHVCRAEKDTKWHSSALWSLQDLPQCQRRSCLSCVSLEHTVRQPPTEAACSHAVIRGI